MHMRHTCSARLDGGRAAKARGLSRPHAIMLPHIYSMGHGQGSTAKHPRNKRARVERLAAPTAAVNRATSVARRDRPGGTAVHCCQHHDHRLLRRFCGKASHLQNSTN